MKKHLRAFTGVMLFAMAPTTLLAQTTPDEVDHIRYRSILDNLQIKLQETRSKLTNLESERTSVRQEIDRMNADRRDLPNRTGQLNRDIQTKLEQDRQLAQEITSLNQTLQRVGQDIAQAERDLESLGNQWRQADSVRQSVDAQLRAVEGDITRLQTQLDREVNEERESMRQLDALERDIERLTGRRQAMAQDHRDRQVRHQQELRDLQSIRQRENQLERQLQTAQEGFKQADEANTQATQALNVVEAELTRANQAVAPFQRKVEDAKKDVQATKAQLDALEKITTDAETNIRGMEQRKATAGQQLQTLNNSRNSQTSDVASAQQALDARELEASQATTTMQADKAAMDAAQQAVRDAIAQGRRGEVPQLVIAAKTAENKFKASQVAAAGASRTAAAARTTLTQKQDALKATEAQITNLNSFLARVDNDIAAERSKIAQNAGAIQSKRQELQGKRQTLQAAEGELTAAAVERDRLAPLVQQARKAQAQTQGRRDQMETEVKRVRQEHMQANRHLREVQESIASFPQDIRRIEDAAALVGREIQQRDGEADRERRLLARIRNDRVNVQNQLATLSNNAQRIGQDLQTAERNVQAAESIYQKREAERNQMNIFADNTRRSIESNSAAQAELRRSVEADRTEIANNSSRLAQIDRDFAGYQSRSNQLNQEIPVVSQQISSLETQVSGADSSYRQRLTLFQRYLGEAQTLGNSRGNAAGQTDGSKAGVANMNSIASRLGMANGSEEGRFEALLRAFVRAEVAGFNTGRAQGLASAEDATRGTQEGTATGTREARDHAEQVLKPRYYTSEFQRRLSDSDVRDEVAVKLAAAMAYFSSDEEEKSNEKQATIPTLTAAELAQSRALKTSLDQRIESAIKEIARLREEQGRISVAANVYLAPTEIKAPIDAKTCEGVYKNVKDLVDACESSFKMAYDAKFMAVHRTEFMAGYTVAFNNVISREREAVIQRDFAANYAEGEAVARAVGLAIGKEEVYQARFAESRASSYQRNLPIEDNRVRSEAVTMVDQLFAANGVAMMTEEPKFVSSDRYGITPGSSLTVAMVLKNSGMRATPEGGVKIRILEISSTLQSSRTVAPLKALPARKIVKTNADFGFKVADTATPGERVRLKAEIIYPGHDYVSSRTEKIEIEEMVGVSPEAKADVEVTAEPQVANAFGFLRTLNLSVNLTAKYRGLDKGYNVTLEEVGSNFVSFSKSKGDTKVLGQGQSEKVIMAYKIQKTARGKEVKMKLVVRYGNTVVEEQIITVKPR